MNLPFKHSILARLSLAFMLVALLAAILAGSVAFYDAYRETHSLQDDLLRQTAAYINPAATPPKRADSDNDARIYVQTPQTSADDKHYLPLPDHSRPGFNTIRHDDDNYRVYIRNTPLGRVVVMQENDYREDLAVRAAWRSALPLLLLMPLMMLFTILILRRTLKPVRTLSQEVEQRREHDLTPLDTTAVPNEIYGFVAAINRMLVRTDKLMQQQQRFIADAAHELRSPMTALSVQAERLSSQPMPEPAREQVHSLLAGIRRNRRLLEQLLTLARAQAPEATRRTAPVNMQALFQRVIEDLLPLAEEKEHDLGVTEADVPEFNADDTDIYILVKTLADNAVRYTPAGSRIDLSAVVEKDFLIIRVEDDGSGIAAAERQRVLDPFYRILGSGQQGTGLGLSIADTIAKRYGGRIELADSPHFAHGLLVEIFLPWAALQARPNR